MSCKCVCYKIASSKPEAELFKLSYLISMLFQMKITMKIT